MMKTIIITSSLTATNRTSTATSVNFAGSVLAPLPMSFTSTRNIDIVVTAAVRVFVEVMGYI